MDWIQFLQIICVPAFGWFFYKLGEQRKEIKSLERDLNEFKVALAKVLINYKKTHGLNTVRQIISRYAPPNENQTTAYIQSVAKQLGVAPDTVIDIEERGALTVFIKAIIRMENGIQPYSDPTIQQGIDLCLD